MTTVLLPFAVQFSHAVIHFGHHHACQHQNELHIDSHHNDCDEFHFQINHNSISFENSVETIDNSISNEIVTNYFDSEKQIYFLYKPTRAPPYSML